MMKKTKLTTKLSILLLIAAAIITGCDAPDPIVIVVTPTPDTVDAATAVPTLAIAAINTDVATSLPTNTEETASPTPSNTPVNFIGPIIGQDYVSPTPEPAASEQVFVDIPTVTPTPEPPTPIPEPTNTPGPTPTPVPGLDANRMGLQLYSNVEFDQWMAAIGMAQATGVRWIKVQVNWAFLQPEGPGVFGPRLQLFERQMEAVKRAGFNLMLSVAKAPDWARSGTTESGPPDDPQALAEFVRFMLQETKIGGVTDAIEIWNEPNLIREWRTPNLPFDGAGYMQLFAPTYDVIRAYSLDMVIITSGLAPTSNIGTDAIDDRLFLQQMYDAGLANYQDIVIGAHPYGWGNPPDTRCCDAIAGRGWDDDPHFFFIQNIEALYRIMQTNRHGNQQIWVTEFGWATWEGLPSQPPEEWVTYNSAQDQANYTMRAFQIAQDLDYLGPMVLWNLNFANAFLVENSDEIAGYSIINPVLLPSERPLFFALSQATGATP